MGYGPLAYVRALWELATPFGKETMKKKANNVRKTLLEKMSNHAIAQAVVRRAQSEHPDRWFLAASAQVAQICKLSPLYAEALVSEHCTDRIFI